MENYRDTTIDGSNMNIADLPAPALNQNALDNDAFQIYMTYGSGIFGLPYTSEAGGQISTINFLPRLGHFIITRFTYNNTASISLSPILQFRYIIIPGGILTDLNHHVNLKNYAEVKQYYHLPN